MLLVLLWAIVATRKRKDQRIVALKLAELTQCASVIGQLVIWGKFHRAQYQNARSDSSGFGQISRMIPAFGGEQHTSKFPGAGRSSGSGLKRSLRQSDQ